ncbi:hypothetical protein Cob_v005417 [Colletotrichum orbiculare MAFF 240422]|uniref:Uncharacterized protein n=1 Tax=Colletotrichum orbiculare (strain 104-T / ATCC 96160 / CBS 514.97 / LARS 414 / MAFF 240422) TaxID=1213857 RepID=A0A484FVQ8_COLOR|nr:hypothetical protein Cob_v005417 [Colletotrichum orbiculare MAFF 240422]
MRTLNYASLSSPWLARFWSSGVHWGFEIPSPLCQATPQTGKWLGCQVISAYVTECLGFSRSLQRHTYPVRCGKGSPLLIGEHLVIP